MNTLKDPAWEFQHSVECKASRELAWTYWTNIANWEDPPAKFELEGRFEAGSKLATILPGQTLRSVIREVKPGREATIEMQLEDATLSFHWKFEELSKERVRITQRLTLDGANAKALIPPARVLEQSVPDGMEKLAAAIERSGD